MSPSTNYNSTQGIVTSPVAEISARTIAVDGDGNIYLAGFTDTQGGYIRDPTLETSSIDNSSFWKDGRKNNGASFPGGPNVGTTASSIFVTKFDTSGARLWSRQIGTINADYCITMACDGENNIIVPGYGLGLLGTGGGSGWLSTLVSGGLDPTAVVDYPTGGLANERGYLVKFNSDGEPLYYTMVWSGNATTIIGGTNIYACIADSNDSNSIYVAGKTHNTMWSGTPNGPSIGTGGTKLTPFIKKYNSNLSFATDVDGNGWHRYIEPTIFSLDSDGSVVTGMTVDSSGNVYAVGQLQSNSASNKKYAFIAKYSSTGVADTTFAQAGGGLDFSADLSGVKIYRNHTDDTKDLLFKSCYIDSYDNTTSPVLYVAGVYNSGGELAWNIETGASSFPGTKD